MPRKIIKHWTQPMKAKEVEPKDSELKMDKKKGMRLIRDGDRA